MTLPNPVYPNLVLFPTYTWSNFHKLNIGLNLVQFVLMQNILQLLFAMIDERVVPSFHVFIFTYVPSVSYSDISFVIPLIQTYTRLFIDTFRSIG